MSILRRVRLTLTITTTFLVWATGAAAVAGGPVGLLIALAGFVAADLATRLTGDYLRYIG